MLMEGYVEKFSKLENSGSKIAKAWSAGNKALMQSMGETYYFLDDNQLGTAMLINDESMNAIKKELVHGFGNNVDGRTLTLLAKSIASGTFFTELGKQPPKATPMPVVVKNDGPIVEVNNAEKEEAARKAEMFIRAKRAGMGNPVFQKLIPGGLDGKFLGKTGKFTVEYPGNVNVSKMLNSKVRDIADFADEQLGNDEYNGNKQRIFVSKELKKDKTSVCVVMYHGIEGDRNTDIAAAVREGVRDAIPYTIPLNLGGNTSVLSTELHTAETRCAAAGFDNGSRHDLKIKSKQPGSIKLDESLAPRQASYEQEACFAM